METASRTVWRGESKSEDILEGWQVCVCVRCKERKGKHSCALCTV